MALKRVWSKQAWQTARDSYLIELEPRVRARRKRRSRGEKDPVEDFLWEYYSLRGGRLLTWSQGAGVVLEEAFMQKVKQQHEERLKKLNVEQRGA